MRPVLPAGMPASIMRTTRSAGAVRDLTLLSVLDAARAGQVDGSELRSARGAARQTDAAGCGDRGGLHSAGRLLAGISRVSSPCRGDRSDERVKRAIPMRNLSGVGG
jgi:hypothetical protein